MVTQVSIIIMGHERRMTQALRLSEELDCALMIDNNPPSFASERLNGDMAWRFLAETDAEWGIVIQDDALPINGFREHAINALDSVPDMVGAVSFYVGTGRPYAGVVKHAVDMANMVDASWLMGRGLYWGVAVAIRTKDIADMLDAQALSNEQYDVRIGDYFKARDRSIAYTWPSLVNHADEETLIHGRKPSMRRQAHRLGPRGDYTGPVVQIGAP